MEDKPSSTALLVATGLHLVAATPHLAYLVPKEAAALTSAMLRRHSNASARFVALSSDRPFRYLAFALQAAVTPGIFVHYAARKRFIETAVRQALAEGFEQVVVLGAGFDTLCLRLHREAVGVRFFEVDHPATQNAKLSSLPAMPGLGENLSFLAINLAESDFKTRLESARDYDAKLPTVFVAEGLLMYLSPDAVRRLLAELSDGPVRRVVFTAMALNSDGTPGFTKGNKAISWWLRRKREPFLWGVAPSEIDAFVASCGLTVVDRADADRLRRGFLGTTAASVPLAEGEIGYVAERLD